MKKSLFLLMLVLLGFAGSSNAQIGCDRACLSGFMDSYLNALYANNPAVVPVANEVKITDKDLMQTHFSKLLDKKLRPGTQSLFSWFIA